MLGASCYVALLVFVEGDFIDKDTILQESGKETSMWEFLWLGRHWR